MALPKEIIRTRSTDPDKPLTDQQTAFVRELAKGNSVKAAALRAGYAYDVSGYQLMHHPAIQNAVAREKAKYEKAAEMTRKKVMDGLLESIEMAKLMSEPNTMIQGWKVVAQMCGYLAPVEHKVKVDVTGSVTMKTLTSLTDAELLEMIEKGSQPLPEPEDLPLLTDERQE